MRSRANFVEEAEREIIHRSQTQMNGHGWGSETRDESGIIRQGLIFEERKSLKIPAISRRGRILYLSLIDEVPYTMDPKVTERTHSNASMLGIDMALNRLYSHYTQWLDKDNSHLPQSYKPTPKQELAFSPELMSCTRLNNSRYRCPEIRPIVKRLDKVFLDQPLKQLGLRTLSMGY